MVYGARQWSTRTFGDGSNAAANAVPVIGPLVVYTAGTFGGSSLGVSAYGGPAAVTPGVIPPVVYTIDLVGALPITGALGPKSLLFVTASLTSTGAFVLQVNKKLAGALTSAGTLTMRASDIRIQGVVTPTGVLRRIVFRSLAGTITPAGALRKGAPVGASSELGLSGTLVNTRYTQSPNVTGTLTPAAVLKRQAVKALAGSLFPGGAVSFGIQSPGGYSGTIAPQGSLILVYPGGLTAIAQVNLSGRVTFTVQRQLTGAIGSSGSVQKISSRSLSGLITPASAFTKSARRFVLLSGSIAPAATYRPNPQKRLAGSVTSSSAMIRTYDIGLEGSIGSAGSRTLQGPGVGTAPFVVMESALTPRGRLTNTVVKNLSAQITPTSSTVVIYYEPTVLVPGFVYTKSRRGVLLP